MIDHDDITPPAEAPTQIGEARPSEPHSIRATQETLEALIEETPADAVPSATPAATAAPVAAESAPTVPLYPESTPEGRLQRGVSTGTVPYSADDVEACRDRLSPEQYHDLHAAAVIADRQRATLTTYQQQQRERLASRVPEVRDPESRRQFTDELAAYVSQFDYGERELLSVEDSRAIELARHGLRQTQRVRELERELAQLRAGTHPTQREDDEAPTRTRRRARPRIDPADLRPMGIHAAKRLLQNYVE